MWAIKFISRASEKIAARLSDVAEKVRSVMNSINQDERADRVCEFNRRPIIIYCSERVTAGSECDNLCFLRHQSLEVVPIKLAGLRIHLRDLKLNPAFNRQCLPRSDVGVM